MKVFFLSDIHLENGESPAAQRFVSFLDKEPQSADFLLLGGDIFDLLVGDKEVFRARYRAILDSLRLAAERGVKIFYLEGNHDFHFGAMFEGIPNFEVRTRDFEVNARGRRIWVSHGDLIDKEDRRYRFLRAVTKNAAFKAFVWALPNGVVDFIGRRSSGASRKYTAGRVENEGTARIRILYLEFARRKVGEGIHHVLVGHSHLRDQISVAENGRHGEYVNLGFSAESLAVAVLESGAEAFSLRNIT